MVKSNVAQTMPCDQCGNALSLNARSCPACSFPTAVDRANCRTCGAVLAISKHRRLVIGTSIQQGNTVSNGAMIDLPCSKCGELRPLAI